MDPAQLVKLAIAVSVPLLVFSLGLRASFADASSVLASLFRSPHRLARAVLSMNVLVPLAATAVVLYADLPRAVRLAVLAMAVAPIPPILPGKQLKFGGHADYVFGLLVAVSLLSIVTVPTGVDLLGRLFGQDAHVDWQTIAGIVGKSIFAPLLLGLLVHQVSRSLAERLSPWVARVATVLLVLGLIPVLVKVWPVMATLIGTGAVLAIAVVVALAITIGHLLGGPSAADRKSLAIASAMRHPGVALAVASVNAPDEPGAAAAVLLYVIIAAFLTTVYAKGQSDLA